MGQDWGGRHKAIPEGAPKVTSVQVKSLAESIGVRVRRETPGAWSMWLYWSDKRGSWVTLGNTNWEACNSLNGFVSEELGRGRRDGDGACASAREA